MSGGDTTPSAAPVPINVHNFLFVCQAYHINISIVKLY